MGELLVTVGQAWPRLLLYPGGLSAIALAWVLSRGAGVRVVSAADLMLAAGPLLLISLLPLPGARDFPYTLDLFSALLLLELPRWHARPQHTIELFMRPYLALLLGAALLFQASGSFALSRFGSVTASAWPVAIAGALIWSSRCHRSGANKIAPPWLCARRGICC
ncbi:hypothetical protein HC891_08620 [Candidatus Gracilibacteria bacterium]|nr:hypothetical protein [Candidatus Gracilibacteria bacterium]